MKSLQLYALCALCATPALIQAQESTQSNKVDAAMAKILAIFDCVDAYNQTLDDFLAGKITAEETLTIVEALLKRLEQLKSESEESVKALSNLEQQRLFTEMKDPNIGERIFEQDKKMQTISDSFGKEIFSKNAALKAACEKFHQASYLS